MQIPILKRFTIDDLDGRLVALTVYPSQSHKPGDAAGSVEVSMTPDTAVLLGTKLVAIGTALRERKH